LVRGCGRRHVSLGVEDDQLHLRLPARIHREPTGEQRARVAEALGIAATDILRASIIDVGPVWFTLQLPDALQVIALEPDMGKLAALAPMGVTGVTTFGLHPPGSAAQLEVRSCAPAGGIPEDPVCDSGHGCVADVIQRERLLGGWTYVAAQGRCLGRDGRVLVRFAEDGTIWLGGAAVTCVEG